MLLNLAARARARINLSLKTSFIKERLMSCVGGALNKNLIRHKPKKRKILKLALLSARNDSCAINVLKAHNPGEFKSARERMRDPSGAKISDVKLSRRRGCKTN
jgi:hypothetical protein